jgi:outer membrane protein assembly factor BamB
MFPPARGNAIPTPCTDGHRVIAMFGTGDLACLDMQGRPLWLRSLSKQYGEFTNEYGIAASPVLADGKVVVQIDQAGNSYLLALDAKTGQRLWKEPRAASDNWASPVAATIAGRRQIICSGTHHLRGYDLTTGEERWSVDGMARLCTPTPLVHDRTVVVSSAPGGCVIALHFREQSNDPAKPDELWRSIRGVGFIPTGVRVGDLFFMVSDRGTGSCFDVPSGELKWQERIGGTFRSSLVAAGDNVYFTSLEGVTTVVRAAPKYELVSRNELDEAIAATPAISNGALFMRTENRLLCIRQEDLDWDERRATAAHGE